MDIILVNGFLKIYKTIGEKEISFVFVDDIIIVNNIFGAWVLPASVSINDLVACLFNGL